MGCETRESLTRTRIRSVEKGLLRAIFLKGDKPEKMNLTERMRFYRVPAVSLAVLNKYRVEWTRAYGVKEMGTSFPATEDTLFQAGALSQPLAAVAALHFVEQSRLDLESDVNTWLRTWKIPRNAFTAQNKITLRGLLTHTAGFPDRIFPGYSQREPQPSLKQIL